MQTLQINSTLQDGKYRIEKVLGQGGFGITYLANHELLGTKVAIKEFFFKQYCDRDEATSHVTIGTTSNLDEVKRFEEKFLKEARNIAKLNHPNIIKIHDVFRENNTAYYVMDYIEGENLADLVKERGALPEAEAVNYIRQAADALAYIHEQHLNHLDVKPANLMLRKADGKILLIDFGMSKQYDAVSGNQTSTTPVGISHGYAPIEQYKEGGVQEFSPQTDIYALGATLYKLVTGITPPQATEIAAEPWNPEFPSSVSNSVINAIKGAMEVQKGKRPATIKDFNDILCSTNSKLANEENNIKIKESEKDDEPTKILETKSNISPSSKEPINDIKKKGTKEGKKSSKFILCLGILAAIFIGIFLIYNSNRSCKVTIKAFCSEQDLAGAFEWKENSLLGKEIPGCNIFIDGESIGKKTPAVIEIKGGLHQIRVVHPDYEEATKEIYGLPSIGSNGWWDTFVLDFGHGRDQICDIHLQYKYKWVDAGKFWIYWYYGESVHISDSKSSVKKRKTANGTYEYRINNYETNEGDYIELGNYYVGGMNFNAKVRGRAEYLNVD